MGGSKQRITFITHAAFHEFVLWAVKNMIVYDANQVEDYIYVITIKGY